MDIKVETPPVFEPEKPDFPDDHAKRITIEVDSVTHEVRPGEWLVSTLKAKLGIDPSRILAEITPNGLIDLDDNSRIHLRDGEKFATHARTGSSS